MFVDRRNSLSAGRARIKFFTTAVIFNATRVLLTLLCHPSCDLKQLKNATIPHHGNLCAVEHDDVATVAAPAEKQMDAMVSNYLDRTHKTIQL